MTNLTNSDVTTAEALSRRFARVLESADAADVFTDDAFFDLNMPVWRFQIQGPAAFATQLAQINEGDVRIEIVRTVETTDGFVQEHVEHQDIDGREVSARRLVLCGVRDGRICDVVIYCTGEWDEELRTRHAIEAPMLRADRR
jgi:hypothetical protein